MDESFVLFDFDDNTYLRPEATTKPETSNPWWTYHRHQAMVYTNEAHFREREGKRMRWPDHMVRLPVALLDDPEAIAVIIAMHKAFAMDGGGLIDVEEG